MRLPASKVYRAFPELDRFSDEQCERFMVAARRGIAKRVGRVALQVSGTLLVFGLCAGVYWQLVRHTGFDPNRGAAGGKADAVLALALTLACCAGGLSWLMIKDRLLRGRIRRVLNTRGSCAACGYVMAGLPVGADMQVTCPECGYKVRADAELGEVVPDETGAKHFLPSPEVVPPLERWLTPRRRRLIRRLLIGIPTAVVVLALAGWGGYEWFLQRQAGEARAARTGARGLIEMMEGRLAPGVTRESANAWAPFGRAVELMARTDIKVTREGPVEYPPALRPEYSFQAVLGNAGEVMGWSEGASEAQLRELAGTLIDEYGKAGVPALFAEMAACPRAVRPLLDPAGGGPLFQLQLAELGSVWQVGAMNAARMKLALQLPIDSADRGEFVSALEANLALVRMLKNGAALMDRRAAGTVLYLTQARVRECLAHRPDREWLDAIQGAIDRQRVDVPFAAALKGEEFITLDTIAWVFEDPARTRAGQYSPALQQFFGQWGMRVRSALGTYRQNRDAVVGIYAQAMDRASVEPFERKPLGGMPPSELLLVEVFASSVLRSESMADQEMLYERGMAVLIALERFRGEHGGYPERIEELALPMPALRDPWTGRAFCYRRTAPCGGKEASFILYSVGADGVDDGGVASLNEYSALWSGGAGFDFVIGPVGAGAK